MGTPLVVGHHMAGDLPSCREAGRLLGAQPEPVWPQCHAPARSLALHIIHLVLSGPVGIDLAAIALYTARRNCSRWASLMRV